jgi:uncharacterized protein
MAKDCDTMEDSNRSSNPSIHDVSDPARRQWLRVGGAAFGVAALASQLGGCGSVGRLMGSIGMGGGGTTLGFKPVPAALRDGVGVPEGYLVQVLAPWGEAVGLATLPSGMPAWKPDASNSAADQAAQMGMHHDGIHYYALDGGRRGLLVMNHEYVDNGLLHPGGLVPWTAAKVAKAQAAHGIAVIEIEQHKDGRWVMVRPSIYARRITATTPRRPHGAGHHRQLRQRQDALGHLLVGRGKLGQLLHRRRHADRARTPLGHPQGHLVPLAGTRRAL